MDGVVEGSPVAAWVAVLGPGGLGRWRGSRTHFCGCGVVALGAVAVAVDVPGGDIGFGGAAVIVECLFVVRL